MNKNEAIAAYLFPSFLSFVGLVPYICEKKGIAIPVWLVNGGAALTVVSGCAILFFLLQFAVSRVSSRTISLSTATALILACVVGTNAIVWLLRDRPETLAQYPLTPEFRESWEKQLSHLQVLPFKHLKDEDVFLDGKWYQDSTFENALLIFNGTEPSGITHSHLDRVKVSTDNLSIAAAFEFLIGIGALDPHWYERRIIEMPEGKIRPAVRDDAPKPPTK